MGFIRDMKQRFNERAFTHHRLVQFRFPKSKKKRIRNKWKKRAENFRWEWVKSPVVCFAEGEYLEQLKKEFTRDEDEMRREYFNQPKIDYIDDHIRADSRIDI